MLQNWNLLEIFFSSQYQTRRSRPSKNWITEFNFFYSDIYGSLKLTYITFKVIVKIVTYMVHKKIPENLFKVFFKLNNYKVKEMNWNNVWICGISNRDVTQIYPYTSTPQMLSPTRNRYKSLCSGNNLNNISTKYLNLSSIIERYTSQKLKHVFIVLGNKPCF